jgi:hypothetical protein
MKAFLDDTKLKKDFVAEIKKHQEADQILQGTYGEGSGKSWKGCAVGCSVHSLNALKGKSYATNKHAVYETELGIPEWLAKLEDTIFEGLPTELAKKWPLRFSKAIPVGADLEPVKWQFSAFILSRNIERVLTLNIPKDLKKQVVDSIRGVLKLHEAAIKTGKWGESAARSAWSAAESAARSAAGSAAESAAGSAARSAWSAWSAARSARSAEYKLYANHLIKLIKETK